MIIGLPSSVFKNVLFKGSNGLSYKVGGVEYLNCGHAHLLKPFVWEIFVFSFGVYE